MESERKYKRQGLHANLEISKFPGVSPVPNMAELYELYLSAVVAMSVPVFGPRVSFHRASCVLVPYSLSLPMSSCDSDQRLRNLACWPFHACDSDPHATPSSPDSFD